MQEITNKFNLISISIFIAAILVVIRLLYIQYIVGDTYVKLGESSTIKSFEIQPNRGNLYSDDGSLLATSMTKYELRFDTQTVSQKDYDKYLAALCDSLAVMFGKKNTYYIELINKAKALKNKYLFIARELTYGDYMRVRKFPLFDLGSIRGGIILEQNVVRTLPMGNIGSRTIGYEYRDENDYKTRVGLEGMFGQHLFGKPGRRIKQKIANGRWKPINDSNEIEPEQGTDVYTTLDVNIQDIVHEALLSQLQKYKAEHGCAVVMEVATGEIKAIVNLGRSKKNTYYEKLNYAIGESYEPGSTFKLMSMVVALDDKVIDTNTVINTGNGLYKVYDQYIKDTKKGGHGRITASRVLEVSSNIGISKIISKNYGKNPEKFVNKLYKMGLNDRIGVPIIGEGMPIIPHPKNKEHWYGTTLSWMAFGYGVSLTPLQTLTFYNAIANNGIFVMPKLIKKIEGQQKKHNKKRYVRICSEETAKKVQLMLKNVIRKPYATGHKLFSYKISLAGKTGTSQKNYATRKGILQYISSFSGYFPANNPKYSCIVVINEPNKFIGYYGVNVAGPVFKEIAEKVYTPTMDMYVVNQENKVSEEVFENYQAYYQKAQKYKTIVPNVIGLEAMDAISLLENIGLKVILKGRGRVIAQSIPAGTKINSKKQEIKIELS